MFNDNILYEFTEPWTIELESRNKRRTAGNFTRRELIDIVKGMIEITQFDEKKPRIIKANKFGITEAVFSLDEIDNANNFENGSPSNTLFTYHVTAYDNSTQYKKLKKGDLVSLVLRMKHLE